MEKIKLKKYEIALSIGAIFVIFCFAFSYIVYHRSVLATLSEYFLSIYIDEVTEEEMIQELENRKVQGDIKYQMPDFNFDFKVEEKEELGMQIYYINEQEEPKNAIIYLHGGAYIDTPIKQHWKFLNKLANNINCEIVVPLYPLAPNHTFLESYNLLTQFYEDYLNKHPETNVILMGDSAGGGLALGLAEHFTELNIPQPDRLILISPWLDLSMSNPEIEKFIHSDPILQLSQLKVCAESWAGDKSLKYWKVSPIYGDLSGLKNVTIFVGTRELFYPDCKLLSDKLEKLEVQCEFNVGTGLNHIYPLFPISEANKAITMIRKNILSIEKDEEK